MLFWLAFWQKTQGILLCGIFKHLFVLHNDGILKKYFHNQ